MSPPTQSPRNQEVRYYVTAEEKDELQRVAADLGLSVSTVTRVIVTGAIRTGQLGTLANLLTGSDRDE